jgi:hypothetical protein
MQKEKTYAVETSRLHSQGLGLFLCGRVTAEDHSAHNDPASDDRFAAAHTSIQKAVDLSSSASPAEQAYILDPQLAMAYWEVAEAVGPNYTSLKLAKLQFAKHRCAKIPFSGFQCNVTLSTCPVVTRNNNSPGTSATSNPGTEYDAIWRSCNTMPSI